MNEKGFTLIELLVVVGIIGILAAVAVPQFSEYRKSAYNSSAMTDLTHAANAEEAYYALNEEYLSCSDNDCVRSSDGSSGLPGIKGISNTVQLTMTANGDTFTGVAHSTKGSRQYTWDSASGGMQESTALSGD